MPKIEFLDHVAIKVSDPERSANWYCEVLGLERFQPEQWKPVPIMVLAGNSGVAIFKDEDAPVTLEAKNAFHFAFRTSGQGFDKIVDKFKALNIEYFIEDHVHFKSVYFRDPDMYRVEVTTPVN